MICFQIIDNLRQQPSASEVAQQRLVRRFEDAARSAASKEYVSELTEEEACAICIFAGVPYEIDMETGRMKFNPCGIYKRHGKWTAVLPPNVQSVAQSHDPKA